MSRPHVLPGAVAAGEYLNVLLGGRYRKQWKDEAKQVPQTSRVQINAVARVVAQYLKYSNEQIADYRQLRDRIRSALNGQELTSPGLSQIIAAFEMTTADAEQLWSLARDEGTIKLITGAARPPEGLYEAVGPRRHQTMMLHEVHQVGPDRLPYSHRTVQMLQAVVDDVDYVPYICDTNAATVAVHRGGMPGRLYRVDDAFFALNIQLTEPLQTGGTALLDYVTSFDYVEAPPAELRRGVLHEVEKVMVEVRFDPAAVPEKVYWAEWDRFDDGVIKRREAVELDQALAVHCYHEHLSQTIIGFCWEW